MVYIKRIGIRYCVVLPLIILTNNVYTNPVVWSVGAAIFDYQTSHIITLCQLVITIP